MPDSTYARHSPMPASADEVYAWHARPGAFLRLQPPWEHVAVVSQEGTFGADGFRVTFRARHLGPLDGTWVVELYDFRPGEGFQYRQVKGPFPFWNHAHRMIPDGPDRSFLENRIDYRLPLGPLGVIFRRGTRHRLAAMFAYRHALTAGDLRRHALYRDRPRLCVAVTGSRGLIGSELVPFLTTGGHTVVRLVSGGSVKPPAFDDGTQWVSWNPTAPPDPAVLDGCDAVVHLAGDGVGDGRWTAAKKRRILDSRTIPTRRLAEAIASLPAGRRPKVFVSASAVGYYGNRGDEELTEDSPPGTGFFPEVCQAWEEAAAPAAAAGVRVVHPRIGVVLTPKGAALGKQLTPFKLGAGAVLGSGKQWVPWVTMHDTVGALHHCVMCDAVSGPVNLSAPHPVTNRELTKTLGRVLRRPAVMWLPRAALRVMFGEIADEALVASLRVLPRKLLDTGFTFDHPDLEPALRFLLGR